jgi:hypothetical protein
LVGLAPDSAAPVRELSDAVARVIDAEVRGSRLEVLIDKARQQALSEGEKQELQGLSMGQIMVSAAAPAAGAPAEKTGSGGT